MFVLHFANTRVAYIDLASGRCKLINKDILPLDLLLVDAMESVQNVLNFEHWCASRTLSMSRANYKRICNTLLLKQDGTDNYKSRIALTYRCLTTDDAYWVSKENENLEWEQVSLHLNSSTNVLTPVSLCGKVTTVFNKKLDNPIDIGVNGTFAKSWVREDGKLFLCKADAYEGSCETLNEIYASSILKSLYDKTVVYTLDVIDDTRVSKCESFTNTSISFIPYSSFKKYKKKAIEEIKEMFPVEYANLAVCTYLIGNEDLHDGNWGLLLDNETFKFIGLAPLFDFNYALNPKTYVNSYKDIFIPESYYIDIDTGNIVPPDEILDYNYKIVSTGNLEDIALREVKNCSLDFSKVKLPYITHEILIEFKRRLSLLK